MGMLTLKNVWKVGKSFVKNTLYHEHLFHEVSKELQGLR